MFSSLCDFTPELTLRETCAQKDVRVVGGMFLPSFKFVFASREKMYTNQLYARDFRVKTSLTVKGMHFVEKKLLMHERSFGYK